MGDIADALRRARDLETARRPIPLSRSESDSGRNDAETTVSRETSKGDVAPALRAAHLEGVVSAVRPAESSASDPEVPVVPTGRRRQDISGNSDRSRAERICLLDPSTPAAAASRRLAQQVKRQCARRQVSSIVITSPMGGDGKTTVSCNLAVSLTRLDRSRSVVLVDLDLRRPRVAQSLGLKVEVGVDDLLAQRATLDEALIETDVPGLCILAPRRPTSSPEHLLASDNLRRLIDLLNRRFWMIVIDTPPILSVSDASSVLDVAGCCLLVVRAGQSPASSVEQTLEHLPADKMLGCCLNFARSPRHDGDYYTYGMEAAAESHADSHEQDRPGDPSEVVTTVEAR